MPLDELYLSLPNALYLDLFGCTLNSFATKLKNLTLKGVKDDWFNSQNYDMFHIVFGEVVRLYCSGSGHHKGTSSPL